MTPEGYLLPCVGLAHAANKQTSKISLVLTLPHAKEHTVLFKHGGGCFSVAFKGSEKASWPFSQEYIADVGL